MAIGQTRLASRMQVNDRSSSDRKLVKSLFSNSFTDRMQFQKRLSLGSQQFAASRGRVFNLVSLKVTDHQPNRKQVTLQDGRTKVWAFNAAYLREALSKSLDEGRIFSIHELSNSPHTDPPMRITPYPFTREQVLERNRLATESLYLQRDNQILAAQIARMPEVARAAPPLPNEEFPARRTNASDIQTAECLVCMDILSATDHTPPSVQCRRCAQVFHIPCISQWLQLSVLAGCPHCRAGRI